MNKKNEELTPQFLVKEISRCEEIKKAFEDEKNYCYAVVKADGKTLECFQCPEPFDGKIDQSKYLFISSNPSYDEDESFEGKTVKRNKFMEFYSKNDKTWFPSYDYEDDNYIFDFFYNRLDRYKNEDYLNDCIKIVSWVEDIDLEDEEIEQLSKEERKKYTDNMCLTEVVHCKSKNENGLDAKCRNKCCEKYMEKIINLFLESPEDKKYIILCGGQTWSYFRLKKNKEKIEQLKNKVILVKSYQPSFRRSNRKPKDVIDKTNREDNIKWSLENQNWLYEK